MGAHARMPLLASPTCARVSLAAALTTAAISTHVAADEPTAEEDGPSPLQVDYAQYGVAFAGEFVAEPSTG